MVAQLSKPANSDTPLKDGLRSAAEALCSENHQASVLRCISCAPLIYVCTVLSRTVSDNKGLDLR